MRRRVLHWLGWTIAFSGALPVAGVLCIGLLSPAAGRSLDGALGYGDGLLVAVAWLAAGIGELRDTPPSRRGARTGAQWISVFVMAVLLMCFGSVFADRTSPGASDDVHHHRRRVAAWSVWGLCLAGVLSTAAVAIGSPEGA